MESLYVTFKVEVSDSQYSYSGTRGEAEMKIQVPRQILESIGPSSLFLGVLRAALNNFDNAETKEDE